MLRVIFVRQRWKLGDHIIIPLEFTAQRTIKLVANHKMHKKKLWPCLNGVNLGLSAVLLRQSHTGLEHK